MAMLQHSKIPTIKAHVLDAIQDCDKVLRSQNYVENNINSTKYRKITDKTIQTEELVLLAAELAPR